MHINFIAGMAAAAALFVPVLLILAGGLFKNGSLLALLFYYLLTGVYVLTTLQVLTLPPVLLHKGAVVFNYLDAPLMLLALLFFCNECRKCKGVLYTLGALLLFEGVVFYLFGLEARSSVYVLGPGTLIIFSFSLYFFAYYGKISIVQGKGTGKTFMLVSILFSYVVFIMVYYLYYIMHTPAVADVYLIYYIGLFLSSVFMSIGLVCIVKRNREMKELQLTRRELALFFDN
jgi:hypothetical protein